MTIFKAKLSRASKFRPKSVRIEKIRPMPMAVSRITASPVASARRPFFRGKNLSDSPRAFLSRALSLLRIPFVALSSTVSLVNLPRPAQKPHAKRPHVTRVALPDASLPRAQSRRLPVFPVYARPVSLGVRMRRLVPGYFRVLLPVLLPACLLVRGVLVGDVLSRLPARQEAAQPDWSRARMAMLGLALLIALLPFWLVSGDNGMRQWFSNRAFAAVNPAASRMIAHGLPLSERRRQVAAVRAIISQNPHGLVGMRGRDVAHAFPVPGLARRDGEISVWQYRTANCIVDIYLRGAADVEDGDRKVVYFEARPPARAVLGAAPVMDENFGKAEAGACLKTAFNSGRDLPSVTLASAMR